MIKELKWKFTLLVAVITLLIMSALVSSINIINYDRIIRNADEILGIISDNGGVFPEIPDADQNEDGGSLTLPNISPELPYESRYFVVVFDKEGKELLLVDTRRIAKVDSYEAYKRALAVLADDEVGFDDEYRYMVSYKDDVTIVTFLNCERMLDTYKNFLFTSIVICLLAFLAIVIVSAFLSERIVRPVAESYEKQKRFITDAGHELKTPLTVISANVDILRMEYGENESLDDISLQTRRLTTLTNDLVYLAKMEESRAQEEMIEIPISDIVEEAATPYNNLAKINSRELSIKITPMLSLSANSKSVQQLVAILLDNAIKYSSRDSLITLTLTKTSKGVCISVVNYVDKPLGKDELTHIFDRFYRYDPSRSSAIPGNGIGLSIASAIARSHSGKIDAKMISENQIEISATLNTAK